MWGLAWRQLLLEPTRALFAAVALAAVIGALLVLSGFERGQYLQLERNVLQRGGDLIVTQAGVANFISVRSSVPQLARGEVEAVPGVRAAHPITSFPVIYRHGDAGVPVFMLVVDTKGGPRELTAGEAPRASRDIVIDRSLAQEYDLGVGDEMVISDFAFEVSGIANGAAALFTPLAFVTYDGMIDLFIESELAPDLSTFPLLSYLLVELSPGADRASVAREIESRVPTVDVFTPGDLAARDVRLGKDIIGPIFGLLVTIAYVIGLLVVSLILYAEVQARRSGMGVLKALGFSSSRLVVGIWLQALLLFSLAIPIGLTLAWATAALIERRAPVYLVPVFDAAALGQTLLSIVLVGLVGAVIPVGAIRRVDPATAFAAE